MKKLYSEAIREIFFKNNEQRYLEDIPDCLCCGSKHHLYLFSEWGFNHYICRRCGFVFVNPRPDNEGIFKFYNCDYFRESQRLLLDNNKQNKFYSSSISSVKWMKEIIKTIYRYKEGGSLLDIGCGPGAFLRYCHENKYNYEYYGTEVSEIYFDLYQDMKDITFYKEDLTYLIDKGLKFDVITLLAVIEHVQNPYELLNNVKQLLRKDGILFLLFPTFSLLSRTYLGGFYHFATAPAHINFFNKSSIQSLLERVGDMRLIKYYENKSCFSFQSLLMSKLYYRDKELNTERGYVKWIYMEKRNFNPILTKSLLKSSALASIAFSPIIRTLDGASIGNAVIKKE